MTIIKAADIMTGPPILVGPDTALFDAVRLMLERRVSGVLVGEADGRVIGVLTEGDLLRRAELGTEHHHHWLSGVFAPRWKEAARFLRERSPKVMDVMTEGVLSVPPDAELPEIVALMEERGIKRVPVVAEGRAFGIVSRADILRAFLDRLSDAASETPEDSVLAARLREEMQAQSWVPTGRVHANVHQGVVELAGEIDDERLREPLLVLARTVPGVKAVKDLLVFVDLYTGTPIGEAPEGPHA